MCQVDASGCDDGQRDRSNEVRGAALMQQCRVCGSIRAGWGRGQHRRISWCGAARFHMLLFG